MINQALLKYIKEERVKKVDWISIRTELLNKGWQEQDINQAFNFLEEKSLASEQNSLITRSEVEHNVKVNLDQSVEQVEAVKLGSVSRKHFIFRFLLIFFILILVLIGSGLVWETQGERLGIKRSFGSKKMGLGLPNSVDEARLSLSSIIKGWVKEEGCEGISFYHPKEMYFSGFPGVRRCNLSTPGSAIYVGYDYEKKDNLNLNGKDQEIEIDGVKALRTIVENSDGVETDLYYQFGKWNLFYVLHADLVDRDYSMQGNFDIYKDYPDLAWMTGVSLATPSADLVEFINLVDQMAKSIRFTSAPVTPKPPSPEQIKLEQCKHQAELKDLESRTELCDLNKEVDGTCLISADKDDEISKTFFRDTNRCYRDFYQEKGESNDCLRINADDEYEEWHCYVFQIQQPVVIKY